MPWVSGALRYKPEGRGFNSQWNHFHLLTPSDPSVALGTTQFLTEISTINVSWG